MAFKYKQPTIPKYNALQQQDQANIGYLLNPTPRLGEVDSAAAEGAIGQGGSSVGNNRMRLRESELISRFTLGNQLLAPYLQRDQAQTLQTQGEEARLNEIAASGAQAMEQLRLQESGLTARASSAERAAMERAVLEGNQAMERLQTSESGANTRQSEELRALMDRFYAGEEGQNTRLDKTIAAQVGEREINEAGLNARQQAALEASYREAVLRGDQQAAQQASQVLAQGNLQTQSERAQMQQLLQQGTNQQTNTRLGGAFDIAGRLIAAQASQPDPTKNPNWRPTYVLSTPANIGMGGDSYSGNKVIEVPDTGSGRDNYGQQLSQVDRILAHYGIN